MNLVDIKSPLLRELDIENEFRMKSYQNMVFEDSDVSESDNESAITDYSRRNDDIDCFSSDDDEDDEDHFYRQCICTDTDCEAWIRHEDEVDTVIFRKRSDILDTMRYVYALPNVCNVTFIVGPLKQPIQGVKTVLGSTSRHLSNLIENATSKRRSRKVMCDHLTINVPHYDYRTFRSLVCFLHSGQIHINITNIVGLLCAAYEYDIRDLLAACWDFVDDIFLKGKTGELRMQCEMYHDRNPVQCILNLIDALD